MKRIVYLTFYFKPDLCAGSFRNSPLALELSYQAKLKNTIIDLYTTSPNRYITFKENAPEYEEFDNLRVHRIKLPSHKSGMIDQVLSFSKFYWEVRKMNSSKKADLVFASSSRLFTAFLGYKIAKKSKAPLFLDIRDIFVDTMSDVLKPSVFKPIIISFLKHIENKTFNYANHINLISEGFKEYFSKFKNKSFSFFSNGIDNEFLKNDNSLNQIKNGNTKLIIYAGNIGEGQGLDKIVPQAAKKLGNNFTFLIYGDGGAKNKLQKEIDNLKVENVILKDPVSRFELKNIYNTADYLFLHLNDYSAFKKVLPSKIFELATYPKTIIAGVSGYSAGFIKKEVPNSYVFNPCDIRSLVGFLENDKTSSNFDRERFKTKFSRSTINKQLSANIINYI
ncbi:glycosyltransferase family 4 protein [Flavobacteriaceae bacterium]|nr:glycosyltransferase family 4 protein [Flavobacteriaceae bacterium]